MLPIRRDGPPKHVPVFTPREKVEADRERKRFYKSAAWRRCRALKLGQDPLCEHCKAADRITPATQVHHVKERRDRPDLAFTLSNLESLCISCHSKVSRWRLNQRNKK